MVTLLFVLGFILAIFGGLWLVVVIFQESILWGLLSLVLPVVSFVYVVTHWEDAKRPFLTQILGIALIIIGAALAPAKPAANATSTGSVAPVRISETA